MSDLLARPGSQREASAALPLAFTVREASLDDEAMVSVRFRSLVDGVLCRGQITTEADLTCTRCLRTWSEPLEVVFETVFRIHPQDEDDEYPVLEGGWIDLEPAVHDEVSLALPYVPVCSPGCRGLCQTCGTDLNTAPCAGHGAESDSPFAALKHQLGHLFD